MKQMARCIEEVNENTQFTHIVINVRDIHGSLDAIFSLSSESPSIGWSSGAAIVISPLISETKLNSFTVLMLKIERNKP